MNASNEVGEFLSTRRARISPERAGVQRWGGRRRVAGLRREEVAQLAGMSTDYYARLERGNLRGVSEAVLESLARALQLDEVAQVRALTRSDEFRTRWAAHDVRHHHTGVKAIRHPVVGELRLGFEVMRLPADEGLSMVVYSAEPGTPAADGLRLLAGWAADRVETSATTTA